MATTNGTATDYLDLLDKFNTFVTGLSGGNAWTVLRGTSTEKIWSAPGGGSDEILVGMKAFFDAGADYYNLRLGGFLAFDSGQTFEQQVGYVGQFQGSPKPSPVLTLRNASIGYRFYATGRRAIILAKVSSVYCVAYLGFLAAYAPPGAWPYPLVVGGNLAFDVEPGSTDALWRFSNGNAQNANFPIPKAALSDPWESTLRVRNPGGEWMGFDQNTTEAAAFRGRVFPYCNWGVNVASLGLRADLRDNLDGSYTLFPIVLFDQTPNVYGELDGIFMVSGFNNAAENIVNDGTDDYFVVPNVFRTDQTDFFAIKET